VPRLYLATPVVDDPASLIATLPALLAVADVAAVLVRLKQTDQRTMISRIKALAPVIQDNNAALLLDGHVELVARAGADGAHLTGIEAKTQRPSVEAIAERLEWWAELFEPPCVGFAASCEEAHEFAAAGADFILVGDFIWEDARGAAAALIEVEQAIRQAHAAMPGKAHAEQG
jgi:thiamine-phosphate pyrophosphorylase